MRQIASQLLAEVCMVCDACRLDAGACVDVIVVYAPADRLPLSVVHHACRHRLGEVGEVLRDVAEAAAREAS